LRSGESTLTRSVEVPFGCRKHAVPVRVPVVEEHVTDEVIIVRVEVACEAG